MASKRTDGSKRSGRKIGYAVAGLGHIAQTAVLPAFAHAKNSRLVALIRSRTGIRLDPSGVLWLELQRGEPVLPALRNVLLGLQGQG